MSEFKTWNGSAFTTAAPKIWNGANFVDPDSVWVWEGGEFKMVWPAYREQILYFTTAGTFPMPIPLWATYIDIIGIGGGGGGGGHGANHLTGGKGGAASSWSTQTLARGWTFGAGVTEMEVVVGAGGLGSDTNGGNGYAGGDTIVRTPGSSGSFWQAAGGAGGLGSENSSGGATDGGSPGNITAFGVTLTGGIGGIGEWDSPTNGTAPGAGGGGRGGGLINGRREGMQGARGELYVRFRSS